MPRNGLTALTEMIRTHPEFPGAARRYLVDYVDWRERLGMLNRVIANAARQRILENLLTLHFSRSESGGGPGVSFERLVEVSGATDDVGARAVRTALRLAQIGGLVVNGRDAADGRLRVYQPTDALIGHGRELSIFTLRPLDIIFPHLRICEKLAADPAFYGVTAARVGRVVLQPGLRRPGIVSPLRDLMRQEGAIAIYNVVADCYSRGRDAPAAPELSRRFFVSQSQARAVLRSAEAQGLFRIGPRGRLLDAEPLTQGIMDGYARFLAFYALHIFGIEPPGSL